MNEALMYWQRRSVASRLCAVLASACDSIDTCCMRSVDRNEEIRIAKNILISARYAFNSGPCGTMCPSIALVAAWSVFREGVDFVDVEKADLESWFCAKLNRSWAGCNYSVSELHTAADILIGGPRRGWLVDLWEQIVSSAHGAFEKPHRM